MNNRYYSLDIFRGATVALMILVNNPGSWSHIYAPLEHAPWHGCTPTDLVFPFFLFAVGNALSFVMPRFEQMGTAPVLRKVVKRTLLIFVIGLLLNWSPFIRWDGSQLVGKSWETVRIMGVLQRIALCYFFASLIIYFGKTRLAYVIGCILLLLYWFLCIWLGAPQDPFSLAGYFGTSIDINLFGASHVYKGEGIAFDPEGLASTIPAIVQVIIGFLAGQYIQQKGKSYEMLAHLCVIGIVLTFTGYCWSLSFPLNKKIWTSSYVLYTSGLAIFTLATLILLIEFRQFKAGWLKFFDVFGKNPLFIFVLSGFLPRLLGLIRIEQQQGPSVPPVYLTPLSWLYEHVCKAISSNPETSSLIYAICMVTFYWFIAFLLDKKKIYVKV